MCNCQSGMHHYSIPVNELNECHEGAVKHLKSKNSKANDKDNPIQLFVQGHNFIFGFKSHTDAVHFYRKVGHLEFLADFNLKKHPKHKHSHAINLSVKTLEDGKLKDEKFANFYLHAAHGSALAEIIPIDHGKDADEDDDFLKCVIQHAPGCVTVCAAGGIVDPACLVCIGGAALCCVTHICLF